MASKSYPSKQDEYRKALKKGAFGAPEKVKESTLGIKPDENGYIGVSQEYATSAEDGEGVLKVAPAKIGTKPSAEASAEKSADTSKTSTGTASDKK